MIKMIGSGDPRQIELVNTSNKYVYQQRVIPNRTSLRLEVFMNMAIELSRLATDDRLHVGCLIYNPHTKEIVSMGYNGSPPGQPHCDDVGHEMVDGHCVRVLHGDDNALHWAGSKAHGCWMIINYTPCRRCVNLILRGGITKLFYHEKYGEDAQNNLDILDKAGIYCIQI